MTNVSTAMGLITSLKNAATKQWAVGHNDKELIQGFEGLRLKAYLDTASVPTIGWGNTRYANGQRVKMGDSITSKEADSLFLAKLKDFALEVKSLVKVPLNDHQGAALLSFQYNTGALAVSTLLKKLNKGDYSGAADEFLSWVKVTRNGKKEVSPTLVRRRGEERKLFLKPINHV